MREKKSMLLVQNVFLSSVFRILKNNKAHEINHAYSSMTECMKLLCQNNYSKSGLNFIMTVYEYLEE